MSAKVLLALFAASALLFTKQVNAMKAKAGKNGKTPKGTVKGAFKHGVASGSPKSDAMIFWTRYTPVNESTTTPVEIEYRIARMQNAKSEKELDISDLLNDRKKVRYGKVMADPKNDWTVKFDITGLAPATSYVYGFTDGFTASEVGKTKTLPADGAPLDSVRFVLMTCANITNGYFHAYDVASTIQDLDMWYHAGDYIYEYGNEYCNAGRCWEPPKEIVTLQDYRTRYASYHKDEGLRNLRRYAPLISTWDDHEMANNAATTGAENHNPATQGSWDDRVKVARQAYLEWMPFRMPQNSGLKGLPTQKFEFGDLMTFVTVDTRIRSRSAEPSKNEFAVITPWLAPTLLYTDPNKYTEPAIFAKLMEVAAEVEAIRYDDQFEMIGQEQIDFIAQSFQKSMDAGKPWQFFGDQTMMGKFSLPCITEWYRFFPDEAKEIIRGFMNNLITSQDPLIIQARAACAMVVTGTPFFRDSWDGYSYERKKVLEVLSNNASNPVVLFGDSHDSWAFQIDNDGGSTGTPVTVNVGAPGVTSIGISEIIGPVYKLVQGVVAQAGLNYSEQQLASYFAALTTDSNSNLIHSNVYNKGFFAVTVTREEAVHEFYGFAGETLPLDFKAARAANGDMITADFYCTGNVATKADGKASLENRVSCDSTEFMTSRPGFWHAKFDPAFL